MMELKSVINKVATLWKQKGKARKYGKGKSVFSGFLWDISRTNGICWTWLPSAYTSNCYIYIDQVTYLNVFDLFSINIINLMVLIVRLRYIYPIFYISISFPNERINPHQKADRLLANPAPLQIIQAKLPQPPPPVKKYQHLPRTIKIHI